MEWLLEANCTGTDWQAFFPDVDRRVVPGVCARICARCPVRGACAAYAAEIRAFGVWAGEAWEGGQVVTVAVEADPEDEHTEAA